MKNALKGLECLKCLKFICRLKIENLPINEP